MKSLIKILLSLFLLFSYTFSYGVSKVSRACNIADIPSNLRKPVLSLLEAIGEAPIGALTPIADFGNLVYTIPELRKYWVFESFTTDYLSNRYYLYAEAKLQRDWYDGVKGLFYRDFKIYKSPGFDLRSISPETFNDVKFSSVFTNRGAPILGNARAGHPNIVERWELPNNVGYYNGSPVLTYEIVGRHYYYNPLTKQIFDLGYSQAVDCNLSNLGLGLVGD
jgi:hypothetical protein